MSSVSELYLLYIRVKSTRFLLSKKIMDEAKQMPLTSIKAGKTAKVCRIFGGAGVFHKLNAMGIDVGSRIKKIGSASAKGPTVFEVKHTQIAIGHGIAQKIFVELLE